MRRSLDRAADRGATCAIIEPEANPPNSMPTVVVEILIILLLIVANGVFALSEIAVVSARKSRLQQQAEAGDAAARVALELAREPNRFLSTVQMGISLVGILAGVFGGTTLAEQLAAWLRAVPALAPYADGLGIGLVVLAITYLSLVVGELAPKQLGLNNPERTAAAGEHFESAGYRFEVVDMDGRRVDKVLVAPLEPAPAQPQD